MNQTGQRTRESLEPRCRIIVEYAKWTSFSAVKFPAFPLSGGGATVYPLLADVAWSDVLDESKGPISCEEFNAWHRCQIEALCDRAKPHLSARLDRGSSTRIPGRLARETDQCLPQDGSLRRGSRTARSSRRDAPAARQQRPGGAHGALPGPTGHGKWVSAQSVTSPPTSGTEP